MYHVVWEIYNKIDVPEHWFFLTVFNALRSKHITLSL